jgi:hypothetical protein
MTLVPRSARLYLRVATLRRQIMARDIARRALFGGIALGSALIALGLFSVALYLWLSTLIGQIGAVLVLAGLHVLVALVLAVVATRQADSPEMMALQEAEEAAFDAMTADAPSLSDIPGGVARLIGGANGNVGLALSAATTLLGIVRKMRGNSPA